MWNFPSIYRGALGEVESIICVYNGKPEEIRVCHPPPSDQSWTLGHLLVYMFQPSLNLPAQNIHFYKVGILDPRVKMKKTREIGEETLLLFLRHIGWRMTPHLPHVSLFSTIRGPKSQLLCDP